MDDSLGVWIVLAIAVMIFGIGASLGHSLEKDKTLAYHKEACGLRLQLSKTAQDTIAVYQADTYCVPQNQ
jgi:hypothetical protein